MKSKKSKKGTTRTAGRKLFDGKSTKEVIPKLEAVWSLGGTDAEAAFFADISKPALSRFLEKNPKISERKERLKQKPILGARTVVIEAFKDDPNLALKYLERKLKSEFALRHELSGPDGGAIKLEDIISKSHNVKP